MITEGSRYQQGSILRVKSADGVTRPAVYPPAQITGGLAVYQTHVMREGDRLDVLAHRLMHDASLWWAIADINPEILDWSNVAAGTLIRLPVRLT